MKKSTMLLVLVGIMMFGLAGNVFALGILPQTQFNALYFDVDINVTSLFGFVYPAPDQTFEANVLMYDNNGNIIYNETFPVVNGKIDCSLIFLPNGYTGSGVVYVYQLGGNYSYTPNWQFFDWGYKYAGDTVSESLYFQ